jgi:CysZ protein
MKTFISEMRLGIGVHADSISFIHKHKLYIWLLLPIGLNIILFTATFAIGWELSVQLAEWISRLVGDGDSWWVQAIRWSFLLVTRIIVFFIYALFYKNIVFIILAPILALLSEKADEKATGKSYPFSWVQLIKDVIRGVRLAVRNLAIEIFLTLILMVFSFVPIVGLISPFLILIVQSYFYGFSMIDYSCERHKMNTATSVQFVREHKGLAIGLGISFYLMFLIPYIGWILAPVIGIIAGTLSFLKIKKPTS